MKACTIAFVAALGLAGSAGAQTAPAFPTKSEKVPNVRYLTIETLETKPGARTWEIISKHFIPAAKAAGVPAPSVYHTETGAPRTIIVSNLSGGAGDMEWRYSPEDVKWMSALAQQLGGQDKAMALVKEYNEGIAHRSRELVHMHTD